MVTFNIATDSCMSKIIEASKTDNRKYDVFIQIKLDHSIMYYSFSDANQSIEILENGVYLSEIPSIIEKAILREEIDMEDMGLGPSDLKDLMGKSAVKVKTYLALSDGSSLSSEISESVTRAITDRIVVAAAEEVLYEDLLNTMYDEGIF